MQTPPGNSNALSRRVLLDPYVVATAVLVVLVSIPLATTSPDSIFWTSHYPYYFDAPILALTVLAMLTSRRQAAVRHSRRFWSLLAVGFVCWLSIRLLGPLLTSDSPAALLATDLLYLAFYLFLILAFQLRPHLLSRDTSAELIHQLETTGVTLFSFGLLAYFVVIPATYNPSALLTNVPSMMLYVVLSSYLFLRALALRHSCGHESWCGCYNWFVLSTAGFVLLDGFDLATRIYPKLNLAVQGTLVEALWLLPTLGFVAAARQFAICAPENRAAGPKEDSGELVWMWRGKLTYFALVPPLIHILLEILGWSDEHTRSAREIFVVLWTFAAAGVSFLYDRRLLRQQRKLERRHRLFHEQLEVAQRMDTVRRMAGGIAHDFNNLLMVIQGFAEVLVTKLRNNEDRSDAEQIARASDRAGKLTRKLLALGSTEKVGMRPFKANDALMAMMTTLQQQASVTLELDLQDTGYVGGDQGAFEDAMLNLVLNAREAIAEDGSIRIRTGKRVVTDDDLLAGTLEPGNYGYAVVEDNGVGMDEETRSHVFEPFYSKRKGGTGLGLSMVYSFASEAGGTVEVDSKPGVGSLFRIILPEAFPARDTGIAGQLPSATPTRARTILLVEDEDSVRQALKQSLESAGIRVLEAQDGSDALRVLTAADAGVDLVITDVVMPNMDGGSLAQNLQDSGISVPIIFMTGHSAGQLDRLGARAATARILRKPFSASDMLLEIENILKPVA